MKTIFGCFIAFCFIFKYCGLYINVGMDSEVIDKER